MSGVAFLDESPTTVRELAKLPPAMPHPDRPRVVIATSPPVFGVARMFELQGQDTRPNFHVVGSEKEAFAIWESKKPTSRRSKRSSPFERAHARLQKGHPVVDCNYGDQKEEQEKTEQSDEGFAQETCAQEENAEGESIRAKGRV
jgi:hypothetical protein